MTDPRPDRPFSLPSWRGVLLALLLAELGALVLLVAYLAVTDQRLVLEIGPATPPPSDAAEAASRSEPPPLLIPVAGVRADELVDSYGAARGAGREHQGIDIRADPGTPVLAAADGVIVQRYSGGAGGIALYQRGLDGRTIYYYAHLQGYASGLKEGDLVRRGQPIARVGDSGNARGNPHLHFAVYTVTDPNRWWRGRHIDPYGLLGGAASEAEAAPGP